MKKMKKSIYCFDYCDKNCLDVRIKRWNKQISERWTSDIDESIYKTAISFFYKLNNRWINPPSELHPVEYGDMLVNRCEELVSIRDDIHSVENFPNWWGKDWDAHLKTSYPYLKDFKNKINYTIHFYSDLLGCYGDSINKIKTSFYPKSVDSKGKVDSKSGELKPFTMQQVYVFTCMLAKMTDQEIADNMGIARRTANEHRQALLVKIKKLGIESIILFEDHPINDPMKVRTGFEHYDYNPSLSKYQYEIAKKDRDFWRDRNEHFEMEMVNLHSEINDQD